MFRVHNHSFHEIEKITWEPEWRNCRLALSGWFTGRQPQAIGRMTRVYLQSSSALATKQELENSLQGSLALYRLLEKQKAFCGRNGARTAEHISDLEQDYQAHQESPEGTSFLRRVAGPSEAIIVVNDAGDSIYFGKLEGYRNNTPAGSR